MRVRRWFPLVTLAAGAGIAYAFDPVSGRRRRGHAAALLRHEWGPLARRAGVAAELTAGRSRGMLHRLHPSPPAEVDDVGLAHRVETVLYRNPEVPKGSISINAEDGRLFLRGQVESPQLIGRVGALVHQVVGVREVVNLLRLPGTPPPPAPPTHNAVAAEAPAR
jgi:hypothetical protein